MRVAAGGGRGAAAVGRIRFWVSYYIRELLAGFGLDIQNAISCVVIDSVQLVTFSKSITKKPLQINTFLVVACIVCWIGQYLPSNYRAKTNQFLILY